MNQQSQTRGDVLPFHGHRWQMTMHLDGCHHFSSFYKCECGATLSTFDERDIGFDSWSAIWMIDEGGEERCERCLELLDGAEPTSRMVYIGSSRVAA